MAIIKKRKEDRSEMLSFRVTPSMKAALEKVAKAEKCSVSVLIIQMIEDALRAEGAIK